MARKPTYITPLNRPRAVARLRGRIAKLHTARMLGWDDLNYFLAFARAGSMQAAAKASGVNQSTVQRRIAELEERISRPLVERHLGGYRLTELGVELRPAVEAVGSAVGAPRRRVRQGSRRHYSRDLRNDPGESPPTDTPDRSLSQAQSHPAGRADHQRPGVRLA